MAASFTKRPKLSITEHAIIFGFMLGVLYAGWFGWHLFPWNVPVYMPIVLYALFLAVLVSNPLMALFDDGKRIL